MQFKDPTGADKPKYRAQMLIGHVFKATPLFEQVSGPFSGIDLVLASHRHHDHNQARFSATTQSLP